jgi:hypothetical protein
MFAEAALAMTILAGEKGLLHIPSSHEVRFQSIAKADNETGWPFSVDKGHLSCVWSGGTPVVMFFAAMDESEDAEAAEPRGVLLSANPLELTIGNIATRDLFAPAANVEERLLAVAPFIDMGRKLCDQPAGERVRAGEL